MTEITLETPTRRRKRSDVVADQIKCWVMDERFGPGHKLPQEKELSHIFGVSKGTMREALKSLEVQGLITVRTGPGGGATLTEVTGDKASALLANYFYSRNLSLENIYAVRKLIEPQLADAVTGHLDEADIHRLEQCIDFCSCEPFDGSARHEQRIAELDFHDVLADACPNPVLAFYCRFINTLLKNMAVCRKIYQTPQHELGLQAHVYHRQLVDAFREGDRRLARQAMYEHMVAAESILLDHQTIVERRFLLDDGVEREASLI